MTKAKLADALLCAAKHWQNEDLALTHSCCATSEWSLHLIDMAETLTGVSGWLPLASAALSEVEHGMGFETEQA